MAHPHNPGYIDGDFSTPVRISRTTREYLFALNGDITSAIYDAVYVVDALKFTPTARGTVDPENAGFYLLKESRPEIFQGRLATFRRTYGNVPAQQIVPSSIVLTRPDITGTFGGTNAVSYGDYRVFQPDTTLLQYDAYRAQAVTSDSGAPTPYPTGGTYTITFDGDTTGAIAFDAAAGTVQTALNALTSITDRGGVTVAGAYNQAGGLVVTFATYAQITIAIGSLTGSGTISKLEVALNNCYTQSLKAFTYASPTVPTFDTAALIATGTITNNGLGGTGSSSDPWYISIYAGVGSSLGATYTGGTFTITIAGVTSGAIAYNATLADLQDALDTMAAGKYTASLINFTVVKGNGESFSFVDRILSSNNGLIGFYLAFNDLPVTGGTYTLTAFGQTTSSLSWSASAGTVESALNALTEVQERGNVTVTGDLLTGFAITFTNAVFTSSAASLTPTGCGITTARTDGAIGRVQRITFSSPTQVRDLYVATHGFTLGEPLFIKVAAGPAYYAGIVDYSLPDSNTIRLNVTGSVAWLAADSITEVGRRSKRAYTPGSATVPCKRITDFYLPGVTAGIASADDIEIPMNQGDSTALLLAIFSGAGTLNVQVGELAQWLESPILTQTRTTVRASDL